MALQGPGLLPSPLWYRAVLLSDAAGNFLSSVCAYSCERSFSNSLNHAGWSAVARCINNPNSVKFRPANNSSVLL
jgi:hypothetical protein